MLIDTATIEVKGGDGGNGCSSFRREKFVPRGGPNGGDGGHGGSVVFEAARGLSSLLDFRYRQHYKAQKGRNGIGANKRGRDGEDIVLLVPPGTIIKNHESGDVLADLEEDGARIVIARGGRGGRGNARFATPVEQAPRKFEGGRPGEQLIVDLELKLIADVGLVGLPNAGKSTLLSRVSAAKPKTGNFPFTTLSPVLGIVGHGSADSFVMADLPGLIEGAHRGKGLGHRFLRHVERTRVLVILLDSSSETLMDDYETLLGELESYGQGLSEKPRIVALNKIDLSPDEVAPGAAFGGEEIHRISGFSGQGLDGLTRALVGMLAELDD
ncbi:MAG: GTPase ObgE [Candidatus Eisenbacteria bacterium]